MQKRRGIKDIQLAINLLEEALVKLREKNANAKAEIKDDLDNDDIRALEEKLKENNEIAERLKEQIEALDKEINDKENDLEKLNDNVMNYNI